MHSIKILGTQGSRSCDELTTCIQITKHTLIDAGNIVQSLGGNESSVNNIFLTHSHLDHVIDGAFILDNFFSTRTDSLRIYGLPQTIEAVKKHIFNNTIWPDFTKITLPTSGKTSLIFEEIEAGKIYEVEDGITLEPIMANHTVPCCGYVIRKGESGVLFSGDTYKNPQMWEYIDENPSIKAVIVDVSFPNHLCDLAKASKHLTPNILKEELLGLKRKDLIVYANHLKPFYAKETINELEAIGIKKAMVMKEHMRISLETGEILPEVAQRPKDIITKLTTIGTALSAESNIDVLLEMIVEEAKNLTNADGGTLYLKDGDFLRFKVVQTDSLGIKMGGTHGEITWPALPLFLEDESPNTKMVAAMCALKDIVINIPDVYAADGFSFDGTKAFDKNTGYRSKSMLVIPLKNHEDEIIGVLQLINKIDCINNNSIAFDRNDASISLSLASQAAVSLTNKALIEGLENLLEGFLKGIIVAVRQKSPYTAGHIERMVQLSIMLTNAIHNDQSIYKDKHFTQEQLRQINFAALMHDIGKLATPEQVVDKATKLEAIFDRIELIESRFELLKSALKIELLEGKLEKSSYDAKIAKLDEAFAIIESSNKGSEFLTQEKVDIINAIAKERWNIGGKEYMLLDENEAYNLSVQRGTLTSEEREIINAHAKVSVDILDNLPFPKKYRAIPQISGSHHEKINGKGYPKGLKGDEISFEARILAIADIFEALTANDRPYKQGMSLSQAMKILYFMAKDDDLDREMVKFFYNSGIYKECAKIFLPQSHIDEVTVDFSSL